VVADAVDLATSGALLEQASLPVEGLVDQFPSAYVLACGGPEIRVFVLTTTAASYFERLGFPATPRSEVPPSLSAAPEFARVCPASAACLARAP
jgi:N-acetylglutamate synthase-like GNAT family acetyltransferase